MKAPSPLRSSSLRPSTSSGRADHLAEMRIAVAERCSLAEARRRLAVLKWAATAAALHKVRGGAGSSFEGRTLRQAQGEQTPSYWWNQE
jgi:hypothetical protein